MQELYYILKSALLVTEFIAVLVGAFYLIKHKHSYWKWFSIYLIIIFIQECFWYFNNSIERNYVAAYYVFFGVPLQYIFLYWLYALKSFKNKNLFILTIIIYITTIIISFFFMTILEVFSLSTNIGTIILIGLIILEFIKQIKTENILKFKENKMFYISLGLILFYIGNYPYHILGAELIKNYPKIAVAYDIYFITSNCIMYLLFSASIIWGKTK